MKNIFYLFCALILTCSAFAMENAEHDKALQEIKSTFGMVPTFFKEFPESGLAGAWEEFKNVQFSPTAPLSPKTRELIGLAVASQIPCRYCTFFHKQALRFDGATDKEMNMAIAVSATNRKWSSYFNGAQLDMASFKTEADKIAASVQKNEGKAKKQILVTDLASAKEDMQNTLGFVPNFINAYPEAALPGAWSEVKNILMSSDVLPAKDKNLMSLAVSSQTPCSYCIYIDTAMAKAEGATPAEIQESIAMAGMVRHWSTVLNGLQQDEKAFQTEVNSMFKYLQKNKHQDNKKMGLRETEIENE